MFKYVELCVDLKKGRLAKDGLMQYRIACQQVNVQSLEEVVKKFLHLATVKVEDAIVKAGGKTDELMKIADLELEHTPEQVMLKAYSMTAAELEEDGEKESPTPWFKFLWETYRNILEVLRNNNKMEALYQMVSNEAFQFCVKYERKSEFRKVCETLRAHLNNLLKYKDQRDRPDLNSRETQDILLDVRFQQLDASAKLGMWNEAFRSVEDIHGLMFVLKRSPRPTLMASYFAALTKVFFISQNYLCNAYAWIKLYNLSKGYLKNLSDDDLKSLASGVVLSALCIPPYEKQPIGNMDADASHERDARLASLLGYQLENMQEAKNIMSRELLIKEIKRSGMIENCANEVKDLFNLLESGFHPLDLCLKAESKIKALESVSFKLSAEASVQSIEVVDFIPLLKSYSVLKMFSQQSMVYKTLKLEKVKSLVPFLPYYQVEMILVRAVKAGYLSLRIDHQQKMVLFVGDNIQEDSVDDYLVRVATTLRDACRELTPSTTAASNFDSMKRKRLENAEAIRNAVEEEHRRALARKQIIERRKEEAERLLAEQEKEEEERRLAAQRSHEAAEAKRLEVESRQREEKRIRAEMEEKENEEALALLAEQEKKKGKKIVIKLEEGQTLDKRILMETAIKEQISERQEMEKKLLKLAKTMDHFERAKREEMVPLIEQAYQGRQVDDEKFFHSQQKLLTEKTKVKWELDIVEKKRLQKMMDAQAAFKSAIMLRRADEFAAAQAEQERKLEEAKKQRKAERVIKRRKAYIRLLQELELEAKDKAEALERKKHEADMEVEEARRPSSRGPAAAAADSERSSGGFVPPHLREERRRDDRDEGGWGGRGGDRGGDRGGRRDDDRRDDRGGGGDRWGGGDRESGGRPRDDRPPSRGDDNKWGGGGGGRPREDRPPSRGFGDRRMDDRDRDRRPDDRDRRPDDRDRRPDDRDRRPDDRDRRPDDRDRRPDDRDRRPDDRDRRPPPSARSDSKSKW